MESQVGPDTKTGPFIDQGLTHQLYVDAPRPPVPKAAGVGQEKREIVRALLLDAIGIDDGVAVLILPHLRVLGDIDVVHADANERDAKRSA